MLKWLSLNPVSLVWGWVKQTASAEVWQECEKLRAQNETLSKANTALETSKQRLTDNAAALASERDARAAWAEGIRRRTSSMVDGAIWQSSPRDALSSRQLSEKHPPIIAVVNLKGGVGKTTVTANLAATYWEAGNRVLLVDLDYQSSLSLLTLRENQWPVLHGNRRFVSELIGRNPRTVAEVVEAIGDSNSPWQVRVVAAHEDFHELEMKELADWIFDNSPDDIRFRLRRALHTPEVRLAYDMILLDCPPRLTLGCVNALAACDFVIIPSVAESFSVDAVTRTLHHLRKFRDRQVCPDLRVLGVARNKTQSRTKDQDGNPRPTWQDALWNSLGPRCNDI